MRRRSWIGTALALAVAAFAVGCSSRDGQQPAPQPPSNQTQNQPPAGQPQTPPPPATQPQTPPATPAGSGAQSCLPAEASDYFPYTGGITQATYAGKGNEFASFKVKVVHTAPGKVEWRKDNGGTVSAEVFQVAPNVVTRIYREGEAYDNNPRLNNPPNASEVLLKNPIKVGTTWASGNTTYTIQSINEQVQALGNQTLSCVLMVEAKDPNSTTRSYWHKQYGLVLQVFNPGTDQVESRLATVSK